MMNTNTKYLRITIHDNDFTICLQLIGELLYESFQFAELYPMEEDFSVLKEGIKHLLLGEYTVASAICYGEYSPVDINYLEPHLEFIDYSEIPDWDNDESIYIPMFDDAEILMR